MSTNSLFLVQVPPSSAESTILHSRSLDRNVTACPGQSSTTGAAHWCPQSENYWLKMQMGLFRLSTKKFRMYFFCSALHRDIIAAKYLGHSFSFLYIASCFFHYNFYKDVGAQQNTELHRRSNSNSALCFFSWQWWFLLFHRLLNLLSQHTFHFFFL